MSNLRFIKVSADDENKIINVDYTIEKSEEVDSLDFFHDHVSNIIDITSLGLFDYEKDLAFVIDDEGLMKSGNLVYLVEIGDKSMHIAGDFLIGRNELKEDGIYTIGFTKDEINDIKNNHGLRVSVYGVTK